MSIHVSSAASLRRPVQKINGSTFVVHGAAHETIIDLTASHRLHDSSLHSSITLALSRVKVRMPPGSPRVAQTVGDRVRVSNEDGAPRLCCGLQPKPMGDAVV